jgi:hypothetical protein
MQFSAEEGSKQWDPLIPMAAVAMLSEHKSRHKLLLQKHLVTFTSFSLIICTC